MIKLFLKKDKFLQNNQNSILVIILWLMVWGGYNTGIERVLDPGFPNNFFDFIHGIRAFLPILVGLLIIIFLFIKKYKFSDRFFLTPFGLFLLYFIVGIISSIFSNNPVEALYWSFMYGVVVILLLAIMKSPNPLDNIKTVIHINWIIAAIITLVLFVFFLFNPGTRESLTANVLICSQRPYELLGDIFSGTDFFGMPGTRPTGLSRYAGIITIVLFVRFLLSNTKKLKYAWSIPFFLSLFILLFSKGKAAMIAFLISIIFTLYVAVKKIKISTILFLIVIFLISISTIFLNIPCSNKIPVISSIRNYISSLTNDIKTVTTLSGRIDTWLEAGNLFLVSPVWGYGFQGDRFFLREGQHVHNTFLHALIQTGLLGTMPFVMALILTILSLHHLFKRVILLEKEKIFLIEITAVFVFIFIRGITESFAFYSADWLFIAPIIAYIHVLHLNKNKS